MQGIKQILFGYDGFEREEDLPEQLISLAQATGARLKLVSVVEEVPEAAFWPLNTIPKKEMYDLQLQGRKEGLKRLTDAAHATGLTAEYEVRLGTCATEIIKAAEDCNADLIAVVDEPRHRSDKRSFGTITMSLMRKSHKPVWALRSNGPAKYKQVLATLDVSPEEDLSNGLDEQIILNAARMAQAEGASLHILHVWSLFGEALLRSQGRMPEDELQQHLKETELTHGKRLQDFLDSSDCKDIPYTVHLRKGPPRDVIPAFVAEKQMDLLVMGTIARKGLLGYLMGNTAERILNKVECAVCTVKPRGFKSPLL